MSVIPTEVKITLSYEQGDVVSSYDTQKFLERLMPASKMWADVLSPNLKPDGFMLGRYPSVDYKFTRPEELIGEEKKGD